MGSSEVTTGLRGQLKRGDWINPIHYTISDLEVVLAAGKTKIREWMKRGDLPYYKIDGTVYSHCEDVAKFISRFRIHETNYQTAC